jgi:uncharacterized protein (TIGR02246 family)
MWKISLFVAVSVFIPTVVSAESATVASGVKSEITTHMRHDSQCRPSLVAIKILAAPANGTVTTEPKSIVVPAPSHCVGKTIDGVAIYFQSKPGFVGQDSFRYQRLNPKDAGDRFNVEISYTISVVAAGAQEKSEIERLNAQFAELFNQGDAEGVAALYADDAVVLPPGSGIVKGKAEIQAFWKKAAETFGDVKLTTVDVKPLGENAARETGYFSLRTKSVPSQEVTGKYIVVWQRIGGEWKLGADIWNEGK